MKISDFAAWTIVLLALLAGGGAKCAAYSPYSVKSYVIPEKVTGLQSHTLDLNGKWDFKFSPSDKWTKINVPGEIAMQGYGVPHDQTVTYRRNIDIPASFAGHKVILRFDGTYSYATLIVNGTTVREHRGGFSRWETDVTRFVHPGKKNVIELRLVDPVEDISYASGYAHHPVCGILRDVTLYAVPRDYISNLKIETALDSMYRNADLKIAYDYEGKTPAQLAVSLVSPKGARVAAGTFTVDPGANQIVIPVADPMKWDAEHPNLYRVDLELIKSGKAEASITKNIGFRDIKIVKDRMLVNGVPVKLRGACRHDIHPELGRATTRATDSIDAVLFKEANMNFVRTSHYPPTERFLEFCDRYGIYVECETGVCFVDTYRQNNYAPGNSQNDSTFTAQYIGQLEEMVKSYQPHPSILFWSIGNESVYGTNFQLSHDFVRDYDTTRPIIFSYPGSQPADSKPIYDILSMHYQDVNGNLWQWGKQTSGFQGEGIPALFDEWAHPACYTYATLREDPNIREFWGKSIDMMWDGVYNAPGALGGAIWGYADEIFLLPQPKYGTAYWKEFAHTAKPEGFRGNCVGYGEWGIVDIWRRKKPEFWATKKAYSPVRVETPRNIHPAAGMPVNLTLFNRFDHTDLSEIKASARYKGEQMSLDMPSAAPHGRAMLTVPAREWMNGDSLHVDFLTADGHVIDSYLFIVGRRDIGFPTAVASASAQPLTVIESAGDIVVQGDGFKVPFDRSTGLITGAEVGGHIVIDRGPYLNAYVNFNHLSGAEVRKIADHIVVDPSDWVKESLSWSKSGSNIQVLLAGKYKEVHVRFMISVTPQGNIDVDYTVDGLPDGYLRETGISFSLPDTYSSLAWDREGYWDNYPDHSMSGNHDSVDLYNTYVPAYGQTPAQEWASDTHNYYYWADKGAVCQHPLTMAAKAMKENVYWYTLRQGTGLPSLSVVSPDAGVACRLSKSADDTLTLYADNRWDYPEIAWGNYCKTLAALPCYGQIRLTLGK